MKISNLFTERDNVTLDPVAVWGAVAFVHGLGLQVFTVAYQHAAFDLVTFGTGMAALIGVIAGGKAVRAATKSETGQ